MLHRSITETIRNRTNNKMKKSELYKYVLDYFRGIHPEVTTELEFARCRCARRAMYRQACQSGDARTLRPLSRRTLYGRSR